MFQYEYEKRPPSSTSCDSRATMTTSWGTYTSGTTPPMVNDRARRPLPPRPVCDRIPTKTSVPLKVWIIASASCFAVCAALVLATVVITKWGATETYNTHQVYEAPEPVYSNPRSDPRKTIIKTTTDEIHTTTELDNEIHDPIIQKLSIFKNIVSNRDNKKTTSLVSKPQLHPIHDTSLHHAEKKIEKKDQAKYTQQKLPEFIPKLPEIDNRQTLIGYRRYETDYEEYFNDDNLYEDYMESNTMTNYLIEKVQELHDWITSDPDFDVNVTKKRESNNHFGQVLKALNDSIVEGNISKIMSKLKEIYLSDNKTQVNKKVILSNSTDLLSFGILTLDVMLLHNIQLMAWENQEAARVKMLKDPEVFAFNALFLEPGKVEAKKNEIYQQEMIAKRQNRPETAEEFDFGKNLLDNVLEIGLSTARAAIHLGRAYKNTKKRQNRPETAEEFDFGKNLLDNVLEIGLSTARAAIHLGRAYKNTKQVLAQLSNKENLNTNIQNQLARNIDGNTQALNHLQTSFNKNDSSSVTSNNTQVYTDLDCVWYLYCRNLIATAKLNAPYGTMARINGLALRMLTGELSTDRAFDTMLYEALTGWTELKCQDMFPRCSKVNAASVVMDTIVQSTKNMLANKTLK
ncbi:hypothetical protein RR46_06981 [Papilio xuthus]|uniref:Uncharacterized protein n=1 Tax=Papilio xuthus TaxID=66420 RepID=A0A194QAE9_PAPXU|nr:hypothetical protein RR46_06981 [Papilio xuthus]